MYMGKKKRRKVRKSECFKGKEEKGMWEKKLKVRRGKWETM